MGKLYDFHRLIDKYSCIFEVICHTEGAYVDGKWLDGLTTVSEMSGAIVPLAETKIYQSGGTLKKTDRQLYTVIPVTEDLSKAKVRYKGKTYSIEEDTDYSDFADVYVYTLRWVSGFDKSEKN